MTKECRDEIYADERAHGGNIESPFFNFVAFQNLAVFTFFESDFSIYALPCDEARIIADTQQFALCDTRECKAYLASEHNKSEPDLTVPRAIAEHWMES